MKLRSFCLSVGCVAVILLASSTVRAASSTEKTLAEIEALKEKIAALESENSGLVQLETNVKAMKEEAETKKKEIIQLEKDLSRMSYLDSVYRSSYRIIPTVSKGAPLGAIQLADGRVVQNAVFSGTTRGGILVATGTGSMTISADQIPASLADKFNLPGAMPKLSNTIQGLTSIRPNDVLGEVQESGRKVAGSKGSSKPGSAKPDETPAERNAAYKAKLDRNTGRWNKIAELKEETSRNYAEKKRIRMQRRDREREFEEQRIKSDRNKLKSDLARFDKQMEDLDKRDEEITTEIRVLRNAIE